MPAAELDWLLAAGEPYLHRHKTSEIREGFKPCVHTGEQQLKDLVVWLVHLPTGTIALLAAIAAFYYPKGAPEHKKAGWVFTITMIVMLISGGIAGALKKSPEDVFLAALVFYTVFTGWLAAHPRQPVVAVLEYLGLVYIVVFGLTALAMTLGWEKARETGVYTFDAMLALMFVVGDIHNILSKGAKRTHRLARHVWRMSFSLIWAALAFGDKIIKMLDSTIDRMPYVAALPAGLVLCVMFYWLFRIYKAGADARPRHPPANPNRRAVRAPTAGAQ